jgi:hypothetical protein
MASRGKEKSRRSQVEGKQKASRGQAEGRPEGKQRASRR